MNLVCKRCGADEFMETGTSPATRSVYVLNSPAGPSCNYGDIESESGDFIADGFECGRCGLRGPDVDSLVTQLVCICGHHAADHRAGHPYRYRQYDGVRPRIISECGCCDCPDFAWSDGLKAFLVEPLRLAAA